MDTDEEAFKAFTDQCDQSIADLALFFTGAPEDQTMRALEQVRSNLAVELAEKFGPDAAAAFAQEFVAAVVGRRREIEAAAQSPSCAS